jgi:hypothetical protein
MRRIFSGTQREAIINHDGCCVSCGFIEQGLFATVATDGSFETLCEECLAPKHLESFSQTTFQPAYLPELSGPVVAHFSRVAAWFYFAARMGKSIDIECGSDGRLPACAADESWWKSKLVSASYKATKQDMGARVDAVRMMRKATEPYVFLRNRVDATTSHFGAKTSMELRRAVGTEAFEKDFRMIPTSIPVARIRSWGAHSTFSNHAVFHSNDASEPFEFDAIFHNSAE